MKTTVILLNLLLISLSAHAQPANQLTQLDCYDPNQNESCVQQLVASSKADLNLKNLIAEIRLENNRLSHNRIIGETWICEEINNWGLTYPQPGEVLLASATFTCSGGNNSGQSVSLTVGGPVVKTRAGWKTDINTLNPHQND